MAQDCAMEFKKENITMLSLWPGPVRTENMLAAVSSPEIKHTEVLLLPKKMCSVCSNILYMYIHCIYIIVHNMYYIIYV